MMMPYPVSVAAPVAPRRRYVRRKKMSYKAKKTFRRYKRIARNAGRFREYLVKEHGGRGTSRNKEYFGNTYKEASDLQKLRRRGLNYRGAGDYHESGSNAPPVTNQLISGGGGITVNASDDKTGDIYLSHREFLGNVQASASIPGGATTALSSFNVVSYPINPGLQATFPWLSQVASNFAMYELIGCIFEYKPTSGEFGTTGQNALGKVVMATQYDPDSPAFVNSVQMENYDYSDVCKPAEHMLHGVETAAAQRATKMLYVRTGDSPKDKVFTDIGLFQIATENVPVSGSAGTTVVSNIGELWVTYRVKLSRAQLFSTFRNLATATDLFIGAQAFSPAILGSSSSTYTATKSIAGVYRTSGLASNQFCPNIRNSLGCTIVGETNQRLKISFPSNIVSGTFSISMALLTQAGGNISPTGIFFTQTYPGGLAKDATVDSVIGGWIAPWQGPWTGNTFAITKQFFVEVTAPGNSVAVCQLDLTSALTLLDTYFVVHIQEANSYVLNGK